MFSRDQLKRAASLTEEDLGELAMSHLVPLSEFNLMR
jgi:hypothetical protein